MRTRSALIAAALVAAAASAQARDVYWSIGIQAPLHPNVSIGTVFSNAPAYQAVPVYYQQREPVVYAEPMYYAPAPVVYLPHPYYTPRRVVYTSGWAPSRRGHGHGHGHRRSDHRQRGEPVMVRYRDR